MIETWIKKTISVRKSWARLVFFCIGALSNEFPDYSTTSVPDYPHHTTMCVHDATHKSADVVTPLSLRHSGRIRRWWLVARAPQLLYCAHTDKQLNLCTQSGHLHNRITTKTNKKQTNTARTHEKQCEWHIGATIPRNRETAKSRDSHTWIPSNCVTDVDVDVKPQPNYRGQVAPQGRIRNSHFQRR